MAFSSVFPAFSTKPALSNWQWLGLLLTGAGVGLLVLSVFFTSLNPAFWIGLGVLTAGGLLFFSDTFTGNPESPDNSYTWRQGATNRSWPAWLTGLVLTGFYVVLYWFPEYLSNLTRSVDSFSYWLRNKPADHWLLYSFLYTYAVLLMGIRALMKYRKSRYHVFRTISVMFFQAILAFVIPQIMVMLSQPEFYFTYFWPLKYDYLFPDTVSDLLAAPAGLGVFLVSWSLIMAFVATPVLTYFYGKRWYCSWVCGCGGLAETAGDPYRHLSDKTRQAWRWEVAIIYPVLGFIILTTALLWANSYLQGGLLGELSGGFARTYGFFIGAVFSGVVGVGFYPLLGSRVWCRFGCPMAAILGILQKHFSRFRITTNGGQCISCGNCSVYCEMGIDVRWYAQQGKPVIRASCVGCGMCSTVCPRGVLKLENDNPENRYQPSALISPESLRILD